MDYTIVSPATSHPDGPAGDELIDGIIADFRATIGAMKCAMSERLVRLGISMTQLNIMYILQRNGVMTMSRVAEVLGASLSNATGLVDRMEERGSVERIGVPEDRRVVPLRMTEAGTRMLQESDALSDELMRDVLARLTLTSCRSSPTPSPRCARRWRRPPPSLHGISTDPRSPANDRARRSIREPAPGPSGRVP